MDREREVVRRRVWQGGGGGEGVSREVGTVTPWQEGGGGEG